MNNIEFVSKVFAVLGYNVVTKHTADLLVEFPKALESIANGEDVHILCRQTGADNITRFCDCLKDYDGDIEKAYECAHSTIGWYIDCILHPNHMVTLRKNLRRVDERGNLLRYDGEIGFSRFDYDCLLANFKCMGITTIE